MGHHNTETGNLKLSNRVYRTSEGLPPIPVSLQMFKFDAVNSPSII